MLFFGDPSVDLWMTFFLFGASFIVSLVVFALAKRKILALIVFSILANISVWLNIGSEMFRVYHIKWFGFFSMIIWPVLNILFIVLVRQGEAEKIISDLFFADLCRNIMFEM